MDDFVLLVVGERGIKRKSEKPLADGFTHGSAQRCISDPLTRRRQVERQVVKIGLHLMGAKPLDSAITLLPIGENEVVEMGGVVTTFWNKRLTNRTACSPVGELRLVAIPNRVPAILNGRIVVEL